MSRVDGGLRALLQRRVSDAHWVSVETPLTGSGIPDSNYCLDGSEGWIEYKQTLGWGVTLRPAQIGWLVRRARAGGRVLVAVRRTAPGGTRSPPLDELWLLAGSAARELRVHGLPRGPEVSTRWPPGALLGCWAGGPASWDWAAVRRVLRTA